VDSDTAVEAAYSAWNGPGADPCSLEAANGVVSAISTLVDLIRAAHPPSPAWSSWGRRPDPLRPHRRRRLQSNERDYAASTFPGEDNVLANTLAQGYYLSDDPYTANQPLAVGSATLYTRRWPWGAW